MILKELRELDRVERIEDLAAEPLGFQQQPERVRGRDVSGHDPRGLEEHLEERRGEAVEAVLEFQTERRGVERVAELGEDRIGRAEQAVDLGIVRLRD